MENERDDALAPNAPGLANRVLVQDGNISSEENALNQPRWMWGSNTMPPWQTGGLLYFAYDPLGRCVKRWLDTNYYGGAPPGNVNPATYYMRATNS